MRLMKTSTLTITRKGVDGYYDDDGAWVDGVPVDPLTIECSVQPVRLGETKIDLPKGITAKDMRIVYTKTELQTSDERLGREPDRTIIDQIPYQVYHVEDWSSYNLRSIHYKVFFVREDKMNGN